MSTATLEAAPARFLTTEQVSALTGIAVQTLNNWRSTRRGGPPWLKLSGKLVRYEREAVEAWLASRTVTPGISEDLD
jgi:predicted DNA-binding transcriptional regulator AlpA